MNHQTQEQKVSLHRTQLRIRLQPRWQRSQQTGSLHHSSEAEGEETSSTQGEEISNKIEEDSPSRAAHSVEPAMMEIEERTHTSPM